MSTATGSGWPSARIGSRASNKLRNRMDALTPFWNCWPSSESERSRHSACTAVDGFLADTIVLI